MSEVVPFVGLRTICKWCAKFILTVLFLIKLSTCLENVLTKLFIRNWLQPRMLYDAWHVLTQLSVANVQILFE